MTWHNRVEMEEYNVNLRAQQLDICEANLCRHEHECDRCEAEVRVAKLSGRGIGMGRWRGSQ
jgi:hypothetical protein